MKKRNKASSKDLRQAVARSSKIEGMSLSRAKKNTAIIKKLKGNGRAFTI